MIVKDAPHAVRIAEALVEHGEKMLEGVTEAPWVWKPYTGNRDWSLFSGKKMVLDDGSACGEYSATIDPEGKDAAFIAASRSLVPALIDAAKVALAQYERRDSGGIGVLEMSQSNIIRFSRAVAPWMAKVGMEVPD